MPHLKPGSSIICTSSVNAYDPDGNIIDYAATRGAIMIFVKGFAKQIAKRGIRVNAVAPAPIWTPLQPSGAQPPDILPSIQEPASAGRGTIRPTDLGTLLIILLILARLGVI
jgi:NAD(P)-dependent dehydrogenase (short-subunit alcohol dehydrogenase family)